MGQAYDQACAGIDQGDVVHRELIAKRIIEAARRGALTLLPGCRVAAAADSPAPRA